MEDRGLKSNRKKTVYLQGRSKRSGWSGHGRTNNRAGKFFIYIFIIVFGRNNNRAGIFVDIIFETETTQPPSHHHSMGGKGPQVHEFVGL